MEFLDADVLPGDSLVVDADLKKGVMTFARATGKAASR